MAEVEVTIDRDEIQRVIQSDEGLAGLVEQVLNQILEAEITDHIGAERHERSPERRGRRNGHYSRFLTTRVGKVELSVPRNRPSGRPGPAEVRPRQAGGHTKKNGNPRLTKHDNLDYDNYDYHSSRREISGMALHSFVGREKQLLALRRELARDRPSVVIVLGRRRVGKSRLLLEATKNVPTIYYQATRVASSMSLSLFKREAEDVAGADPVLDSLSDWLGVLTYLEGVARDRIPGLTVVLDEFPYLCDSDRALPSVFQKFSDRIREQGEPINLVLCGSKIAFMEELLAEKNPMHGRQTLELDLESLPYRDAAQFFPEWTPDQQIQAYAVFGGVPYYLSLCDPARSLEENVRELVLAMGAPLADEPTNLLQAELRDVSRYASILRAIADGCTVSGDIIGRVREIRDASGLSPYIQKLEELRLIRVVRSLDASERERDRRYYLADPFLAFWFRFYLPNASALAAGHDGEVWHHAVEPFFDAYMGDLFEWVCRDHARLFAGEILSTASQEVGQVWGSDYDIDVAGTLLDGSTYSGECKWWTGPIGENILNRLKDVTGQSSYFSSVKNHRYLLYSRSGFTDELEQLAGEDPSIDLVDLKRLLGREGSR